MVCLSNPTKRIKVWHLLTHSWQKWHNGGRGDREWDALQKSVFLLQPTDDSKASKATFSKYQPWTLKNLSVCYPKTIHASNESKLPPYEGGDQGLDLPSNSWPAVACGGWWPGCSIPISPVSLSAPSPSYLSPPSTLSLSVAPFT